MQSKQPPESGEVYREEIIRLADVHCKLASALKEAKAGVERLDKEYRDAKRYMVEYRGEIDPREMFQNELLLKQTDQIGAFAVGICEKIAKLKDSPYFARVDFQSGNSREIEKIYIGRFAFSYENEILVFDWRAPIAGMFYDYEIGPAGYDAPIGRIEGKLLHKRQFKIKNGVMEYAFESSVHVQDEVLQKELSHTSDEKMKSIIATIQKEQNLIIRNEKVGTLIIQGVAGSGKTSIALHRIAYLLYRFKSKLSARNVTILSPNKVFGDYISNVVPELGEEPVYELRLYDIAKIQLDRVIGFEQERDFLEVQDDEWKERARFKSTLHFVKRMEEYTAKLPDNIFVPSDHAFGRFKVKKEWLRKRFFAYEKHPVKRRLTLIADDVYQQFQSDNFMQDDLPQRCMILKALGAMLKIKNTLALYKDFYKAINAPRMFFMPDPKTLEWEDVCPFLYLHAAFEGIQKSNVTKHLVIDEMQDYTPIQYAVINLLFPCSKTILGDFGQFLHSHHLHTLADLRQLYEGAKFIELNKSYRSTHEIMDFAKSIQKNASLKAVERHGEKVALIGCDNAQEELRRISKEIFKFEEGEYTSLGIVVKTNKAAKTLYEILSGEHKINLILPDSKSFSSGVSITSIQMAKGLEFDEVIIPQANQQTYSSKYDRSLLYIACTRPMHKLVLFYTGKPSGFITKNQLN